MIVFFKIAVLYAHRTEFYSLITFTQNNFWHSNYDYQERLIVEDCAHTCAIFIVVLSFCAQGTCAGYMVTPILGKLFLSNVEGVHFNRFTKENISMKRYSSMTFFSFQLISGIWTAFRDLPTDLCNIFYTLFLCDNRTLQFVTYWVYVNVHKLMDSSLANIGKNQSERILPFNMWVDFPTGMSPYFEVFFSIQVLTSPIMYLNTINFNFREESK